MVRRKFHARQPACNVHVRSCNPPPGTENLKGEDNRWMVCRCWKCVWTDIRPIWNVQGSKNGRPRIWILRQRPKMPSDSEERKNGPHLGDVCRIKRANNARNQSTRLSHRHPKNMRQIPQRQSAEQKKLLSKLGDNAKTTPQNAHSCLSKGLKHQVNFITRTTLSSSGLLETSEAIIRGSIIPALISRREPLPIEREMFSLLLKSGGLGIDCPENHHDDNELSKKLSEPLEDKDPLTGELWQKRTLDDLSNAKKKKIAWKIWNNKLVLSTEQRYALQRASEKGASAWLNVLPLKRYWFQINKSEFRDGLSLRYSWNPKNAPLNCPCGETHALHCPKGGYTIVRHNERRDTFANLMSEVRRDVAVEPLLQPLDGETFDRNSTATDDARLDIKANGLGNSLWKNILRCQDLQPASEELPQNHTRLTITTKNLKNSNMNRGLETSRTAFLTPSCFCQLEEQLLRGVKSWKDRPRKSPRKGKKNTPMWCHSFRRNNPFYVSEDAEPLNWHTPLKTRSLAFWPKVKSTKVQ